MTASTWFVLLVSLLVVAGALSVWNAGRRRYVVAALLVAAVGLAWMTHASHDSTTTGIQRERDDARARLEALEEQVDDACSKATSQILSAEVRVNADKDPFDESGYLLFYGRHLFNLCGAEVDWLHAVGETDKEKKLARIRAVREVLERR